MGVIRTLREMKCDHTLPFRCGTLSLSTPVAQSVAALRHMTAATTITRLRKPFLAPQQFFVRPPVDDLGAELDQTTNNAAGERAHTNICNVVGQWVGQITDDPLDRSDHEAEDCAAQDVTHNATLARKERFSD